MLVLSRKVGETVCVGDDVEVFIVDVSRGRVKLGFRAPLATPIRRAEQLRPYQEPADLSAADLQPVTASLNQRRPLPDAPLRQFRVVGAVSG